MTTTDRPSRDQPPQRERRVPGPGPPRGSRARGSTPSSTAAAHGCRSCPARTPRSTEHRLDAWIGKFGPRDAVEHYLVERAVHVSWQLDRADRAEVARLVEAIDARGRRAGRGGPRSWGPSCSHIPRAARSAAARSRIERGRAGRSSPGRSTRSIPATPPGWSPRWRPPRPAATGCWGSGPNWGRSSTRGGTWQPVDRLRAIRLLGKQPLDAIADDPVMSIYLACHAMDPDGPDVFAEPLGDLHRPEDVGLAQAAGGAVRRPRGPSGAPRDAAEGRAALRAIVAAAAARAGGAAGGPRRGRGGRAGRTSRRGCRTTPRSRWSGCGSTRRRAAGRCSGPSRSCASSGGISPPTRRWPRRPRSRRPPARAETLSPR